MKITHSRVPLTFTFGPAETTKTIRVDSNGWVKERVVQTANFTNTVTATVKVTDPFFFNCCPGATAVDVYTSSAIAKNTVDTTFANTELTAAETGEFPVDQNYTCTVTLSGAPGGSGGNVYVILYLKH